MKLLLVVLLAAARLTAQDRLARELDDAARVASVMVDGDLCRQIVTPRAMEYTFRNDPRERYLAGDNYEVNHEVFNSVKKTLIRISRLVSVPADANLWMPIAGYPEKIRVVIRNGNELSQFWPWGALYQDMVPEMKAVLETGKRVTVARKPGWISVLAPVADSLGDTVAVVEVVARRSAEGQENVK